jgi:hypothetical protein
MYNILGSLVILYICEFDVIKILFVYCIAVDFSYQKDKGTTSVIETSRCKHLYVRMKLPVML